MIFEIAMAEWVASISHKMDVAGEGSCFVLPSPMHHHAFELAYESHKNKEFFATVKPQ